MEKYKLLQMSFDGEYVTNSKHETIEEAQETSADLGSKWFFYPWSVIVTGESKTIVDVGGSFVNMKTGNSVLFELFNRKHFKTLQKAFKEVSEMEEMQGEASERFEDEIINYCYINH